MFLNAVMLWALPLAAVPLVIHLLNRRRSKVTPWAAMQFLVAAASRQRRRWKLRDWLLLLLRTAAVLALILAMARPLIRSRWFGSSGPQDVIILLDTSLSTSRILTHASADEGDNAVFPRLRTQAGRLIDQLGNDDACRILLAGDLPRWLASDPNWMDATGRADLQQRLNQTRPTLGSINWSRCLREAVDAPASHEQAGRVITVLTDDQAWGWQAESGSGWAELKEKLQALPGGGVLNVVAVGQDAAEFNNITVESITAPRTVMAPGDTLPVSALIRNTGTLATPQAVARWSVESQIIATTPVPALEPDQTTTVAIDFVAGQASIIEVACTVVLADDLPPDNGGRLSIEVADAVPVLIVDGTQRSDPVWTDTGYLIAALGDVEAAGQTHSGGSGSDSRSPTAERRYPDSWRSPFKPRVVAPSGLNGMSLRDFGCVVLANTSRLPPAFLPRLAEYVRGGGGLWVVLGDQTVPSVFTADFASRSDSLLPLALKGPVGEIRRTDAFATLRVAALAHPATRLLDDAGRLDLASVRAGRRHRFQLATDDAEVSVLLATERGEPVAVEAQHGEGRVIVQTVPLNASWSNLPACQVFVVMVHEWLWYLAEPSMNRCNLSVGEPLEIAVQALDSDIEARLITPSDETIELRAIVRGDRHVFRHPALTVPGRYDLVTRRADGTHQHHAVCVKRDSRESDLTPLNPAARQHLTALAGARFVTDPLADAANDTAVAASAPMWPALLLALLMVLAAESVVAGWTYGKRVSG